MGRSGRQGAGGGGRLVGGSLPEAVVQGVNLCFSHPRPDRPWGRNTGVQYKCRREMATKFRAMEFQARAEEMESDVSVMV